MKKEIICSGCKEKVKTKKEKYVHIEDYSCERIIEESWWHLNCFGKAMNRDLTILEKQAAVMLSRANEIYNNLPNEFNKDKEYII